jgi:hypothetical protein
MLIREAEGGLGGDRVPGLGTAAGVESFRVGSRRLLFCIQIPRNQVKPTPLPNKADFDVR